MPEWATPAGSLTMPFRRRWRHAVANAIWAFRPSLFYFAADQGAREDIRVIRYGGVLEISRSESEKIIRLSVDNALYVPLVVESFDYFFDSVKPVLLYRKGQSQKLVDFSTPRLHRVTDFDDFPVLFPSLAEPFVTTQQYLDFAKLQIGDVAFDLGAYCGLSSIAFAKEVGPSGKVIAVEPDPLNSWTASANINRQAASSNVRNIDLVQAAVAARMGVLRFSSEGAMGSAAASIVGNHRGQVIEVEAVSLQNLADRAGRGRVDFIKMDIEGAELDVILNSQEFLDHYRPKLIIEAHFIDGALTSEPIINCLENLGYDCRVIKQTGLLSLPLIRAVSSTPSAPILLDG